MISRMVAWVIFAGVLIIITSVWSNGVSSEVATDLAMEQLENPSVETSTASRAFGRGLQMPILIFVAFIGTFAIFWKPLKQAVVSCLNGEKDEAI